ncbi:unnamed protein product [Rotaria magnacalcarata]|uniref:Uncharacterized protein n=1 Tax=Rotaria magnacalcarata TaxID=392030 RepID=A0A8S2KRC1_9BILA|nr:unnamed protein product [Rotaria magnacalcarata]
MEYSFEEITRTLLSRTPLPSLLAPPPTDHSKRVSSTPWNQTVHNEILQLQKNSTTPLFAIASLHLFNDDIGSCHDIVEKHSGHDIADYLHYLLHRREGDYWNAKWWIRQLKSQEFKSVYLSEKYNLFGNQKNTDDLSNSAQLDDFEDNGNFLFRKSEHTSFETTDSYIFLKNCFRGNKFAANSNTLAYTLWMK